MQGTGRQNCSNQARVHPMTRADPGSKLVDMPTIPEGFSPIRKSRLIRLDRVRWWGCVAVPILLLCTLCHTPVGVQALSALTSRSARTATSTTVPLEVQIGDRQHNLQVPSGTVADALAWSRIAVGPLDLVDPSLETPVDADMYIRIVIRERRVSEALVPVPYAVVWEGDPTLPIDHQALRAPGRAGSTVQRNLDEHHDGQAMPDLRRTESWLADAPQPRRIAYGRMIVRRVYESPAGDSVDYWRKMRMWTTSYSPARAGTPTDAPWYGYTFSGEPMRNGIVAADLDVLPLGTRVFVEGYGEGEVLDTGGGLGPRDLDLGYTDEDYRSWARWSDVYLLWPPPPADEIVWILPPIQADR